MSTKSEDMLAQIEKRVNVLEESEKIKSLITEFFEAVDKKNIDILIPLFRHNAVVKWKETYSGHEDIRRFYLDLFRQYPGMRHAVSNVRIKVTDENAVAVLSWLFSADGKAIALWGYDEYLLKKEAEAWKIAEMKII